MDSPAKFLLWGGSTTKILLGRCSISPPPNRGGRPPQTSPPPFWNRPVLLGFFLECPPLLGGTDNYGLLQWPFIVGFCLINSFHFHKRFFNSKMSSFHEVQGVLPVFICNNNKEVPLLSSHKLTQFSFWTSEFHFLETPPARNLFLFLKKTKSLMHFWHLIRFLLKNFFILFWKWFHFFQSFLVFFMESLSEVLLIPLLGICIRFFFRFIWIFEKT